MKYSRQIFFEQYKVQFGAFQHQYQVDGLNRLLSLYETYYGWWDSVPQTAHSLAEVKHETAGSFTPVCEGYYLGDPNKPNYFIGNTPRVINFQRSLRYYPHFGMGDIQLTWAENYSDQDTYLRKYFPEIIKDFEKRTGQTFNLITHPAQVLDGNISFCVMTIGMHLGTFRDGHTLDRYITPSKSDHFNARSIINGDKNYKAKGGGKIGDNIAADAVKFEKILKKALISSSPSGTSTIRNSPDGLLNDADIDLLADNFGTNSTATETAVSNVSLPNGPALIPVETSPAGMVEELANHDSSTGATEYKVSTEQETAEGIKTEEATITTPAGDPPTAEPSSWIRVEDWKPFMARWMKRIWALFSGVNLAQFSGNAVAAASDLPNWWVYAIVAVVILVISLIVIALISIVLLLIWYFNRKEIGAAKLESARSLVDPGVKNLGVLIEKK